MKQSLFMLLLMAVSLPWTVFNPFAGLVVYYGLALLRPQFLWRQALEIDWRYSFVLGIVVLGSYAMHAVTRKCRREAWTTVRWMVGVMTVMTVLSFLNAVNPQASHATYVDLMKIFVMFFVACGLVNTRWRLQVIAIAIVVALGWVAVDLNQRYVLMGQKQIANYGHGGLDNNGLAALMVMALPFCLFLFESQKKWYLKWPPLLLMPLMIHVVLFSMSRGGMLGLIVIAPFMLLRMRRRGLGAILLIVLVALSLRLAGPQVRSRLFSTRDYQADDSAMSRLDTWALAQRVIVDHPVLGVGPRGFNEVAGRYNPNYAGRSVHNQFLQTATDLGAPAGAALLVALGAALWHMHKLRRKRRDDPVLFGLAGAVQCSLLGYLAVGMFLSLGTVELSYIVLVLAVGLTRLTADQPAAKPAPVLKAAELPKLPASCGLAGA